MTFAADISALKLRIAAADSARDTWRVSGLREKYLEACSMVDALGLQLEELELMRSFDITFEEGGYRFGDYRYERLGDALSHARHTRTKTAG